MNQGLLGGGPLVPLTVGPRGWPHTWGDERGGPRAWPAGRGFGVFRDAVFWIDAGLSLAPNGRVQNLGYGGSVLDAQYGSTTGTDTNDPLLLPWTGTNYLHLPGLVNNSITCTAPAGTASFSAVPVDGSAPTTGAASPGAFTFQTGGQWARVDLLDAGPTVVASFTASAFTSGGQTSLTDAFAVVWTINRATSGRKSVAVVRPVWLLGTDDFLEVPNNPLIDMNAQDSLSVMVVARMWATSGNLRLLAKSAATGGTYTLTQLTSNRAQFFVSDSVTFPAQLLTYTAGQLTTLIGVRDVVAANVGVSASGAAIVTAKDTTTGTLSNTGTLRIGAQFNGLYVDAEIVAAAVWRRTLSAAEITNIVTYYGGT